ncbi:MAG: cytochrome c biogenesis protein CcsA [Nitrospiraceae bacterium]|nr:MAG: cytochrome c biogenesis protein CcsA [Nitrospiraceae bacterium]
MKSGKIMSTLFFLLIILIPLDLFLIFKVAPTEKIMGDVQRIFYLHVPLAFSAYLGFAGVFFSSILFLWRKNMFWDTAAYTSAEVGVLFSTLVLITGSFWARPVWNVWWTWDPRLITMLILWFIFIGYFLLRKGISDQFKKARYSAVLGIVGVIDIPVVRLATKWWRSIHPRLSREGGSLDPLMVKIFLFSLLTFLSFTVFLVFFRFRVARVEERVTSLMKRLED